MDDVEKRCRVQYCTSQVQALGLCSTHRSQLYFGGPVRPRNRDLPFSEWLQRRVEVDPQTGCWLWTMGKNSNGYAFGRFPGSTSRQMHRLTYLQLVGPVPKGMVLDHVCRVRHCVNPRHLEATTNRVNILRGVGAPALNARMSSCRKGHQFKTESNGSRRCPVCKLEWQRERRAQKKRSAR
jgi:hypothetical protein